MEKHGGIGDEEGRVLFLQAEDAEEQHCLSRVDGDVYEQQVQHPIEIAAEEKHVQHLPFIHT